MSAAERKVRIAIAYDGTRYAGWQVQPRRPTVQGALQDALGRIQGGREISARGAGRTDAGVHATGQVADAVVHTRMDDDGLLQALRAVLPFDIRPLAVDTVDDRFDARRDARAKTYDYLVDRTSSGIPFLERYALHLIRPLDVDAMRAALERLPGTRDWTGFTASACEIEDRVRTMTEATWKERSDGTARFRFTADGFLTYMVRNLVGTVLAIGSGRFDPDRIGEVLEAGDRNLAGPTAPGRGLFLRSVDYGESETLEPASWPVFD